MADAERALSKIRPEPQAGNVHHIPEEGSFVIVANHYERKGLWVVWDALLITQAVIRRRPDLAENLFWLMISEWPLCRLGRWRFPNLATRWLFPRIAQSYRVFLMPPEEGKVAQRARVLRSIITCLTLRHHREGAEGPIPKAVGLFPEGQTSHRLIEARRGVGAFFLLLGRTGIPILPVGLFERGGVLTAFFGKPFVAREGMNLSKEEQERSARTQVMVSIGRLLPEEMWGFYEAEIRAASRPEGT